MYIYLSSIYLSIWLLSDPHDALQRVLVEELPLLGRLLQPEDEPRARDPVRVELIRRNWLEQFLLVLVHESWNILIQTKYLWKVHYVSRYSLQYVDKYSY